MTREIQVALAVIAALAWLGCDVPSAGRIDAADYDQSCSADGDCVAVFSGDYCEKRCGQCACKNSAIARSDLEAYEKDKDALPCGPEGECAACDCGKVEAACDVGQCVILNVSE